MKQHKLYILLIIAFATFYSCSDEQLDIENPNNLSADSFWAARSRATAAR